MATASDVRCDYEKILTRMESLRQYEAIEEALQGIERRLEQFRADAPKDVFGQAGDEWKNRTETQREELLQRLKSILAALGAIESRARCPGAVQRRLLLAYGIATPLVLLILIFLPLCKGALPLQDDGKAAHIAWIFLLILMMGALGGSLRLIGSLIYYLGKRSFYQSWLPYYYLAPVEGALVALVVCMLIFGGFFTPATATSGATGKDNSEESQRADADQNADDDSGSDNGGDQAPDDDAGSSDGGDQPTDGDSDADSNSDADDSADSTDGDADDATPASPDGNQDDDAGGDADTSDAPHPGAAPQPGADGAVGPTPPKPDEQDGDEQDGDDQDGDDNSGVPVYMYAIAGLSGLFAKNVMRKLRDLANTLFGKPSQNDSA